MPEVNPERLGSGVPGLDEVLDGGFLPGRSYLVLGTPGTGKTILALQWLREGLSRGERVLYLTIGEPSAGIIRNVESLSWGVDDIPFVDALPVTSRTARKEYSFLSPAEVEGSEVWNRIHDTVEEHAPDRLVLDSLTNLRHLSVDDFQFRRQILDLFARLRSSICSRAWRSGTAPPSRPSMPSSTSARPWWPWRWMG